MSNRRFFWLSLAAIMIIALLPYLLGWAMTPKGSTFYGNHLIAPADFSIYYSYINQGREGHLLMYDAFTSEAHQPTLIQPLWFVVGLAARVLHASAPLAFGLARTLSIPVLAWTLWWAAGWLWPTDDRRRRMGFILSIIGSGLGGLVTVATSTSLMDNIWTFPDMWVSESFTVLTLWSSAHFVLVTAGIIFILVAVERAWLEQRWSWALWAGVVGIGVTSLHPFHVLTWGIAWAVLTVWHWMTLRKFPRRYILSWLIVLCMSAPILFLYGWQLLFDPITIGRAAQNINLTTVPWALVVGLGGLFIGAIFGAWMWRPRDARWRWVCGITLGYLIAVYLPVLFQRRLSQGMMLPFAWLSVPVAVALLDRIRRRFESLTIMVVVAAVSILSSTWLIAGAMVVKDYADDLTIPRRMYYIDAEHQALYHVLDVTDKHQPLLATLIESNVAAGLTAHQVYVGYGVETLHFAEKLFTMNKFYGSMSEAQQRTLLQQERLCYVLTSPRSRAYGAAFQPDQWPDLKKIWSSVNLALYQTPYCR